MGIFDLFKGKKTDTGNQNEINSKHNINFDALVEDVARTNDHKELTALWIEMLKLDKWIFISKNDTPIEKRQPFIGVVDNKPWIFIFTDSIKAKEFAEKEEGFLEKDGSLFTIKSATPSAIRMILNLGEKGVFGIRINQGHHGWFIPITTLPGIIKHIEELSKK